MYTNSKPSPIIKKWLHLTDLPHLIRQAGDSAAVTKEVTE